MSEIKKEEALALDEEKLEKVSGGIPLEDSYDDLKEAMPQRMDIKGAIIK